MRYHCATPAHLGQTRVAAMCDAVCCYREEDTQTSVWCQREWGWRRACRSVGNLVAVGGMFVGLVLDVEAGAGRGVAFEGVGFFVGHFRVEGLVVS